MKNDSRLRPGDLAMLVNCVDFPEMNGRIVEIVAGPIHFSNESPEDNPWFQYTSSLTRQEHPDANVYALRRCLRRIVPPEPAVSDVEREREHTE